MNTTVCSPSAVKEPRNYGIDLIRILCMIMIPVLHILGKGQILATAAKSSVEYDLAWLLEVFCYGAVNCFGLVSGFVGYGRKVKYANLALLWLRVILYSVIILILYSIFGSEEVTTPQVLSSVFPTLTNSYWYFTAYFGLFLLMPIINKAVESLNKTTLYIISGTFFLFFSAIPTVGTMIISLVMKEDYSTMVNTFSLNAGYSVIWLAVLYFWGCIMKKYQLINRYKNWIYTVFYVGASLIAWVSLLLINLFTDGTAVYDDYLIGYLSPLILQASVGLVCLCANAKIQPGKVPAKIIEFFSPLCFDVYLIHMQPLIKLHALTGKFLFLLDCHPILMVLGVIGFALVIFLGCCVVSEIRELLFKVLKLKKHVSNLETKLFDFIHKRHPDESAN